MGMGQHKPNLGGGKIQSPHTLKDSISPSPPPSVTSFSLLESAAASGLLTPKSKFLSWLWLMSHKPKTQLSGGQCHVASSFMSQH